MGYRSVTVFILICLACQLLPSAFASADDNTVFVYVSLQGDNRQDGSIEHPAADLQGAKQIVRGLIKGGHKGNITVYLREGEYSVASALQLDKNDCMEDYTVTYRAYPGERVILNGAAEVPRENIYRETDSAILQRLPASSRDNIYTVSLDFTETKYYEDKSYCDNLYELVADGEILERTRYPKEGYLYTNGVIQGGNSNGQGAKWHCTDTEILHRLENDSDVYVGGSLIYEWYWQENRIKEINAEKGTVESEKPFDYIQNVVTVGDRMPYYFTNSLALLEHSGEYYYDARSKKIYFCMTEDELPEKIEIPILSDCMVRVNSAKNLVFKNLELENGRSGCIEVQSGTNIRVEGCNIKNFAGDGVNFWSSLNCGIYDSEIYNMGGKGANSQGGSIENMLSSGFEMVNCNVHKTGRINKNQAVAIWQHGYDGGTAGYVGYNEFYDMPFQAVGTGFEGIIENNEIYDVCLETGDMGAIYSGGGFHSRGGTIRYNYIHDIPCNFSYTAFGTNGIYLDGGYGYDVYGNVVANVYRNFYYSSSGGDKAVHDNVFVGNDKSPSLLNPLLAASTQTIRVMDYGYNMSAEEIKESIPEYTYTDPAWISKYPQIKEDLQTEHPGSGYHNIYRNIIYRGRDFAVLDTVLKNPKSSIINAWNKEENPGFVDYRAGNYQLKLNAAAYCSVKDFKKIDMSEIGTLTKQLRDKWEDSVIFLTGSRLCYVKGEILTSEQPFYDKGLLSGSAIRLVQNKGEAFKGEFLDERRLNDYTVHQISKGGEILIVDSNCRAVNTQSQMYGFILRMLRDK
ncbi:MAG: right-handed parallel beta-helix repeat-containing protein [Clostridia bacterium]|nr:right-handed parallel beta-helix repeat-containing protein [Clostridia bacterium]